MFMKHLLLSPASSPKVGLQTTLMVHVKLSCHVSCWSQGIFNPQFIIFLIKWMCLFMFESM